MKRKTGRAWKRPLAGLLTLAMVISLLASAPLSANATEPQAETGQIVTESTEKEELATENPVAEQKAAEIFRDQIYGNLLSGTVTPSYSGKLTRDGYVFKGWTPTPAATVTGNAVYKAVWEKQDSGNGGSGGGSSSSGSGSSSGSSAGSTSNTVTSPKTGDSSLVLPLLLVGAVSLAGIGTVAFSRRKRGYHGEDR